ncbi:MAG: hypothetical protein EU548_01275 [Promethearchaeota archaeon]|nr:MAG: hypothetical protein EU548_01275 [Candidatus Lokiarchaeota archaeon]
MNEIDQEEGKKIITDIMKSTLSEIMIIGRGEGDDIDDYNTITVNIVIKADKWSQKIFNIIFQILQNEVDYISSFRECEDRFACLSQLLFKYFSSNFLDNRDLDSAIKDKIKNLKEINFESAKKTNGDRILIKKNRKVLSLDDLIQLVLLLRKRKVKVFKTLLNEYLNNKEIFIEYMEKYAKKRKIQMKKKENSENLTKKQTKSISEQIFEEKLYKIKIHGGIIKGNPNDIGKASVDLTLWVDMESQIIINRILRILHNEVDIIAPLIVYDDYLSSLQYLLLTEFKNNFKSNTNLGKLIDKKIKELKENKFLTSKYDPKLNREVFEEIPLESFKQLFLILRKRKIEIFKLLLHDFKEHKRKYLDFLNKKVKPIDKDD